MKIACVYDLIHPYVVGGAQTRNWELAKRLALKGHEVHLFGMKHWDGDDVFVREGVWLHGFCKPKDIYVNGRRSIREAIYVGYKVLPPLLRERFDIIDCQEFPYFPSFSSKLRSMLRRTPLVITWLEVWDDYWYEYLGRKGIFGRLMEKTIAKLTRTMIAISHQVKHDLVRIGANAKHINIVPDGVDFARLQQIQPLPTGGYDVMYAGRLLEHKNVDVLVRAIGVAKREINDIKCGIIGDGPERDRLERLSRELHVEDSVQFLGFLERDDDVMSYMKASKVFVLPSTREGAGLVTLEANACGLPVLTIDHDQNAATEVVRNGENGFLCSLSEEDIGKKILLALDRREAMKARCVEFSRRYDWDRMADLTESVYRRALKSPKLMVDSVASTELEGG